jgi:hypothetical protein
LGNERSDEVEILPLGHSGHPRTKGEGLVPAPATT